MRTVLSLAVVVALTAPTFAQYGDISGVKVIKPEDKEDVHSTPPPVGATILFDGKSLDHWVSRNDPKKPAAWKLVEGGAMQVQGGDI